MVLELVIAGLVVGTILAFAASRGWAQQPQVLAFSSQTCRYCPQMKPVWQALKDCGHTVTSLDLNANAAQARQWKVNAVPATIIAINEGGKLKELHRLMGIQPQAEIEFLLTNYSPQLAMSILGRHKLSLLDRPGQSPPVRLIDVEEERELRAMLPRVDDDDVQAILEAGDLVWYTEREIPPAYQFQNTFHSPFWNIAAASENDPFGNGNREFPWGEPGGCELVKNLEAYRFMRLPQKEPGKWWPIAHYETTLPGSIAGEAQGTLSKQAWMYPRGTVFGELLCMRHGELIYPFELRVRQRMGNYWEADAFRPYPEAGMLAKQIKQLRPSWSSDAKLAKLVNSCEEPAALHKYRYEDRNKTRRAFLADQGMFELPPAGDDELVAELLTQVSFKSAQGAVFKAGSNGVNAFAASLKKGSGFHVVPEDYRANEFAVDSQACMQCHRHTGTRVRTFDAQRPWYGTVKGSDGIFSFHPVDPAAISPNGENRKLKMRDSFAGIVEPFDPANHPKERYTKLVDLGPR